MKTFRSLACSLLLIGLSLASLNVSAQDNKGLHRNISLELLGPYGAGGVSYDARFAPESPFGYRVGFGFGFASHSSGLPYSSMRTWMVPAEVNCLLGRKRSKFELGLGILAGLVNVHYPEATPLPGTRSINPNANGLFHSNLFQLENQKKNGFGYAFYGSIGYRLVSYNGFQFRVGLTPSFTYTKGSGFAIDYRTPRLSFGWSF